MESSRIPFLEELHLFRRGSVMPRLNRSEEIFFIYPRSGFSSTFAFIVTVNLQLYSVLYFVDCFIPRVHSGKHTYSGANSA